MDEKTKRTVADIMDDFDSFMYNLMDEIILSHSDEDANRILMEGLDKFMCSSIYKEMKELNLMVVPGLDGRPMFVEMVTVE